MSAQSVKIHWETFKPPKTREQFIALAQLALYEAKRFNWEAKGAELHAKFTPEAQEFLESLATEGERSAVVLGAERLNVAVADLLKSFLIPLPEKPKKEDDDEEEKDPLFKPDASLGTFSRRIAMAYRLGLIDDRFKQALSIIRKLRNDFAHATKVKRLAQKPHCARVETLTTLLPKQRLERFYSEFDKAPSKEAKQYLSCVMNLLISLKHAEHWTEPPEICIPASSDHSRL